MHPGGAIKEVHVVGHPVLAPSGHLDEFVGTVIDITERKRAEEEPRRSEMEFRQILDLVPQLIAVFGPKRERLYANRIALDYLGLTLDEWKQRFRARFPVTAPSLCIPTIRNGSRPHTDRAFSSGAAYELEIATAQT